MKRRLLCWVMVFVLVGMSVKIWPVGAESVHNVEKSVAETQVQTSTETFALAQSKKIMEVGTTATLNTVPPMNVIWLSSNPSVVAINSTTGEVQALKKGTATISAYYLYASGTACTQYCEIAVLENANLKSETYIIEYAEVDNQCILSNVSANPSGSSIVMAQKTSANRESLKWIIQNEGAYYTIKSLSANGYLGYYLSGNNSVMLYPLVNEQAKWRILKGRGGLVLVPYNDSSLEGLALSPNSSVPNNGSYVGLFDYFDTIVKKYWDLECINTYVDNYYDVSVLNDTELRSTIPQANVFVKRVFKTIFDRNVNVSVEVGASMYYSDLTINNCTCGIDNTCYNSNDHSLHHKNIGTYIDEVTSIDPTYRNGKVVMWADRPYHAYCSQSGNTHKTGAPLAEGAGDHVMFYVIRSEAQGYLSSASGVLLLHEITHCFGLPDVYGSEHDEEGAMACVMEYFDGEEAYIFYSKLKKNSYEKIAEAYCASCLDQLNALVEPS